MRYSFICFFPFFRPSRHTWHYTMIFQNGLSKWSANSRPLLPDWLPFFSRALGQGAFGEVYQGYLSTRESGTIAVAAKVRNSVQLPLIFTDKSEYICIYMYILTVVRDRIEIILIIVIVT